MSEKYGRMITDVVVRERMVAYLKECGMTVELDGSTILAELIGNAAERLRIRFDLDEIQRGKQVDGVRRRSGVRPVNGRRPTLAERDAHWAKMKRDRKEVAKEEVAKKAEQVEAARKVAIVNKIFQRRPARSEPISPRGRIWVTERRYYAKVQCVNQEGEISWLDVPPLVRYVDKVENKDEKERLHFQRMDFRKPLRVTCVSLFWHNGNVFYSLAVRAEPREYLAGWIDLRKEEVVLA